MEWNDKFSRENQPTFSDTAAYIATKEWDTLFTILTEEVKAKPRFEHSRCSIPGWNMKFRKKGKNLCTVYPKENKFQVLVIANQQYQPEIEGLLASCDERIQEAYTSYDFLNGGKWLIYDIDNEKLLADTLKLIQYRLQ